MSIRSPIPDSPGRFLSAPDVQKLPNIEGQKPSGLQHYADRVSSDSYARWLSVRSPTLPGYLLAERFHSEFGIRERHLRVEFAHSGNGSVSIPLRLLGVSERHSPPSCDTLARFALKLGLLLGAPEDVQLRCAIINQPALPDSDYGYLCHDPRRWAGEVLLAALLEHSRVEVEEPPQWGLPALSPSWDCLAQILMRSSGASINNSRGGVQ